MIVRMFWCSHSWSSVSQPWNNGRREEKRLVGKKPATSERASSVWESVLQYLCVQQGGVGRPWAPGRVQHSLSRVETGTRKHVRTAQVLDDRVPLPITGLGQATAPPLPTVNQFINHQPRSEPRQPYNAQWHTEKRMEYIIQQKKSQTRNNEKVEVNTTSSAITWLTELWMLSISLSRLLPAVCPYWRMASKNSSSRPRSICSRNTRGKASWLG